MSDESNNPAGGAGLASIPDNVSSAELPKGEMALLNMDSGFYYHLNEVGAKMFEAMRDLPDLEAAVERLMSEYRDVERETLRADLDKLVEDLVAAGLILTK